MKIVSVIFFAAAMTGSWYLTHRKELVTESTHVGIQNDLKRVIAEYIKEKAPQSHDLRFDTFYTQTVNAGRVKATFLYSFEDKTESGGPVRVEIAGTALLDKVEDKPEGTVWNLKELQISDNKIDFAEPITITAGAGEASEPPPAQDTPTEHK